MSAAILAGARDEAKETCPPHHISPFGHPAAQISYLKPKQTCRGQEGAGSDIRQLSLLTILIKQMPVAQAREGGRERGRGPDSLLDTSRRVRDRRPVGRGVPQATGRFSWAEWPLQGDCPQAS